MKNHLTVLQSIDSLIHSSYFPFWKASELSLKFPLYAIDVTTVSPCMQKNSVTLLIIATSW